MRATEIRPSAFQRDSAFDSLNYASFYTRLALKSRDEKFQRRMKKQVRAELENARRLRLQGVDYPKLP